MPDLPAPKTKGIRFINSSVGKDEMEKHRLVMDSLVPEDRVHSLPGLFPTENAFDKMPSTSIVDIAISDDAPLTLKGHLDEIDQILFNARSWIHGADEEHVGTFEVEETGMTSAAHGLQGGLKISGTRYAQSANLGTPSQVFRNLRMYKRFPNLRPKSFDFTRPELEVLLGIKPLFPGCPMPGGSGNEFIREVKSTLLRDLEQKHYQVASLENENKMLREALEKVGRLQELNVVIRTETEKQCDGAYEEKYASLVKEVENGVSPRVVVPVIHGIQKAVISFLIPMNERLQKTAEKRKDILKALREEMAAIPRYIVDFFRRFYGSVVVTANSKHPNRLPNPVVLDDVSLYFRLIAFMRSVYPGFSVPAKVWGHYAKLNGVPQSIRTILSKMGISLSVSQSNRNARLEKLIGPFLEQIIEVISTSDKNPTSLTTDNIFTINMGHKMQDSVWHKTSILKENESQKLPPKGLQDYLCLTEASDIEPLVRKVNTLRDETYTEAYAGKSVAEFYSVPEEVFSMCRERKQGRVTACPLENGSSSKRTESMPFHLVFFRARELILKENAKGMAFVIAGDHEYDALDGLLKGVIEYLEDNPDVADRDMLLEALDDLRVMVFFADSFHLYKGAITVMSPKKNRSGNGFRGVKRITAELFQLMWTFLCGKVKNFPEDIKGQANFYEKFLVALNVVWPGMAPKLQSALDIADFSTFLHEEKPSIPNIEDLCSHAEQLADSLSQLEGQEIEKGEVAIYVWVFEHVIPFLLDFRRSLCVPVSAFHEDIDIDDVAALNRHRSHLMKTYGSMFLIAELIGCYNIARDCVKASNLLICLSASDVMIETRRMFQNRWGYFVNGVVVEDMHSDLIRCLGNRQRQRTDKEMNAICVGLPALSQAEDHFVALTGFSRTKHFSEKRKKPSFRYLCAAKFAIGEVINRLIDNFREKRFCKVSKHRLLVPAIDSQGDDCFRSVPLAVLNPSSILSNDLLQSCHAVAYGGQRTAEEKIEFARFISDFRAAQKAAPDRLHPTADWIMNRVPKILKDREKKMGVEEEGEGEENEVFESAPFFAPRPLSISSFPLLSVEEKAILRRLLSTEWSFSKDDAEVVAEVLFREMNSSLGSSIDEDGDVDMSSSRPVRSCRRVESYAGAQEVEDVVKKDAETIYNFYFQEVRPKLKEELNKVSLSMRDLAIAVAAAIEENVIALPYDTCWSLKQVLLQMWRSGSYEEDPMFCPDLLLEDLIQQGFSYTPEAQKIRTPDCPLSRALQQDHVSLGEMLVEDSDSKEEEEDATYIPLVSEKGSSPPAEHVDSTSVDPDGDVDMVAESRSSDSIAQRTRSQSRKRKRMQSSTPTKRPRKRRCLGKDIVGTVVGRGVKKSATSVAERKAHRNYKRQVSPPSRRIRPLAVSPRTACYNRLSAFLSRSDRRVASGDALSALYESMDYHVPRRPATHPVLSELNPLDVDALGRLQLGYMTDGMMISSFLELVAKIPDGSPAFYLPCHFYTHAFPKNVTMNAVYWEEFRDSRNIDLSSGTPAFFPVFFPLQKHFVYVVARYIAEGERVEIEYFDSLREIRSAAVLSSRRTRAKETCQDIFRLFQHDLKKKLLCSIKETPHHRQAEGSNNCGLHVCAGALYLSKGRNFALFRNGDFLRRFVFDGLMRGEIEKNLGWGKFEGDAI